MGGRICPQASPIWQTAIARDFVDNYLNGIPFNRSTDVLDYPYRPEPRDPRETEDCLFLDILVPARIMLRASDPVRGPRVPVIVWFHGGGYTTGDKSQFPGASGLMQRSMGFGDGVVFVSVNYRVRLPLCHLTRMLTYHSWEPSAGSAVPTSANPETPMQGSWTNAWPSAG